jgi:hypothetical protein
MAKKKKEVADEQFVKKLRDKALKQFKSERMIKRRKDWERYLKMYEGQLWTKMQQGNKPFANFLFSNIEASVPLITDNRPIWHVISRNSFTQSIGDLYNKAMIYLWSKIEMDQKLPKLAKMAFLKGVGLLKVYYDPDADEVAVDVEDPAFFLAPAGYDDIWEMPWCGIRKPMPKSYIAANWPELAEEVKCSYLHEDEYSEKVRDEYEEDEEEAVILYEMWVKDDTIEEVVQKEEDEEGEVRETKTKQKKYPNGRLITFTGESDDIIVLDDKPSPFRHGLPPYVAYIDYDVPGQFFGLGEADNIESLVREYNLRLKQVVEHAQNYHKNIIVASTRAGIRPEVLKEALASDGDEIVTSDAENIAGAIEVLRKPELNRSILDLLGLIPNLIEEVSGVTEISKGQAVKKERQSASEASILIESSYTRTRQKVRNLEFAIKRLAYLMLSLMQQYYSEPREFTYKKDNNVEYLAVSNNPQQLMEQVKPEGADEELLQYDLEELSPAERRDLEDFQRLTEAFAGEDEVLLDFDIEIQTNSTLPADKQTLSQLVMQLAQLKIVDPLAVLETLNFPNAKEIVSRMTEQAQKQAQMAQQAKAQAGGMQPPQPGAM